MFNKKCNQWRQMQIITDCTLGDHLQCLLRPASYLTNHRKKEKQRACPYTVLHCACPSVWKWKLVSSQVTYST